MLDVTLMLLPLRVYARCRRCHADAFHAAVTMMDFLSMLMRAMLRRCLPMMRRCREQRASADTLDATMPPFDGFLR